MRWSGWLASCAIGACAAACTSGPSSRPTALTRPSAPRMDAAPSRGIELSCADAGSATAADAKGSHNLTFGGLTFEGLAATTSEVPLATQVGLTVGPNSDQHFRKTPAYLLAGAPPIVVESTGPAAGQGLAWVPSRLWTSGTPPNLRPWIASKVTFDGCPDHDSTYFGGLLAADPQGCLHLSIQQRGHPPQSLRLRLTGASC